MDDVTFSPQPHYQVRQYEFFATAKCLPLEQHPPSKRPHAPSQRAESGAFCRTYHCEPCRLGQFSKTFGRPTLYEATELSHGKTSGCAYVSVSSRNRPDAQQQCDRG